MKDLFSVVVLIPCCNGRLRCLGLILKPHRKQKWPHLNYLPWLGRCHDCNVHPMYLCLAVLVPLVHGALRDNWQPPAIADS